MRISRFLQYAFIAIVTLSVGFSLYQWNASRASTAKTAPNNGLVGYWSFNEGTGTLAGDASGNNNTGTFVNSPTWGTGKLGSAMSFNGSTNYVSVSDHSSLNPSVISISAWVYYVSQSGSGGGAIVSKYDNSGSNRSYLVAIDPGTEAIGALVSSTGSSGTIFNDNSLGAVPKNKWSHVVMTYDGANVSLYLNGVKSTTSMAYTGNLFDNSTILSIGARPQGSTGYFGGLVDEVRIYNRALSGTEVTNLYNLGAAKLNTTPTTNLTSGLVGYWTFDGKDTPWSSSSAGTATDRSGNANTGTLTNMNRATSVARGKLGQALNFDGVDDKVSMSSDAIGSGAASVCAWVYPRSSGDNGFGRIVVSADVGGTESTLLLMQSGPRIGLSSNGGGTNLITVNTITYNNWIHVCATRDASGSGVIYKNGVLDNSGTTGTPSSGATKVYIGDRGTPDRSFDGLIDEVRVYNRVLSATEVQSLYDLGSSDKVNSSVSQNQGTGRLDSGLVGYWPLDDGSGTNANDASTNNNDGTLTGGPTWGTGQIGGDVVFDGVNDYIPLPGTLRVTTVGSWSVWFKTSASGGIEIIGKDYAGCATNCNHRIYLSSGQVIFFDATASVTNYSIISSGTYNDGQWHHAVATWGSGANLYVDGVNVGSSASNARDDAGTYISIGRNNNEGVGGTWYFNGSIDEVRVYNRVLSADEVSQLYRLTAPTGVDTSLKGYWSFNGKDTNWTSSSAGTTTDLSGNGNTGTMTNMSQSTSIIPGKVGQALNFDGVNDYMAVANNASLQFSGAVPITLSAWVKPSQITTFGTFLIKGRDSISNSTNYALRQDSTGKKLEFYFFNTGVANYNIWTTSSNVFPTSNIWYHVVVTYTFGTGSSIVAYVNGVSVAGTWTLRSGNETADVDTQRLTIGRWLVAGTQEPFTGQIDEVRIYNRALSAPEVAALYNSGR